MPWLRHTDPYFSGPMPWRARWPLSRARRYLTVYMFGVVSGTLLAAAGLGRPGGVVMTPEAGPESSRVQHAGIVMPMERVAVLASARDPDKSATAPVSLGH